MPLMTLTLKFQLLANVAHGADVPGHLDALREGGGSAQMDSPLMVHPKPMARNFNFL